MRTLERIELPPIDLPPWDEDNGDDEEPIIPYISVMIGADFSYCSIFNYDPREKSYRGYVEVPPCQLRGVIQGRFCYSKHLTARLELGNPMKMQRFELGGIGEVSCLDSRIYRGSIELSDGLGIKQPCKLQLEHYCKVPKPTWSENYPLFEEEWARMLSELTSN